MVCSTMFNGCEYCHGLFSSFYLPRFNSFVVDPWRFTHLLTIPSVVSDKQSDPRCFGAVWSNLWSSRKLLAEWLQRYGSLWKWLNRTNIKVNFLNESTMTVKEIQLDKHLKNKLLWAKSFWIMLYQHWIHFIHVLNLSTDIRKSTSHLFPLATTLVELIQHIITLTTLQQTLSFILMFKKFNIF